MISRFLDSWDSWGFEILGLLVPLEIQSWDIGKSRWNMGFDRTVTFLISPVFSYRQSWKELKKQKDTSIFPDSPTAWYEFRSSVVLPQFDTSLEAPSFVLTSIHFWILKSHCSVSLGCSLSRHLQSLEWKVSKKKRGTPLLIARVLWLFERFSHSVMQLQFDTILEAPSFVLYGWILQDDWHLRSLKSWEDGKLEEFERGFSTFYFFKSKDISDSNGCSSRFLVICP